MNEFWKNNYDNLTDEEWDLICSRCGKCCVQKYSEGNCSFFSNIVCKHLSLPSCTCTIFKDRLKTGTCVKVDRKLLIEQAYLLPDSCAYKILKKTGDLPPWHPLKTGNPQSVIMNQQSVMNYHPIYETNLKPENVIVIDYTKNK